MSTENGVLTICVHCGRKCGDSIGGSASVNGVPLCHPNESGRPDCYHMVTVYRHPVTGCTRCTAEPYQPMTAQEHHDAMIEALDRLEQMVRDAMP